MKKILVKPRGKSSVLVDEKVYEEIKAKNDFKDTEKKQQKKDKKKREINGS